jgi:SAM-dependent methyltransferase
LAIAPGPTPTPTDAAAIDDIRRRAVAKHDREAQKFDRWYQQMGRDYRASAFTYGRQKLDVVLYDTLRELPRGGRVLDVGCGTGEQLRRCRELGFQVAGLEPAAEMRAVARRLNSGAPILDGTITRLPFRDASFDGVLAIEVLRYLHPLDVEESYRELLRVLKPGGRAFFTMVNRYALDGYYLYYSLGRLARRLRGGDEAAHCEFVTPAQVRRDLEALGIDDVELHGRMLASLRMAYKLHPRLGAAVARLFEPVDDAICHQPWMTPLAGHLIVIVTRPAAGAA